MYSDLEFDHWLSVESDPNVITYCEQPKEITYVINGKLHSSIFDMWVLYKDGTQRFIEVKYESELLNCHKKYERTNRQIEAQRLWCKENGYSHEVRTEKTIRLGKYTIENKLKMVSTVSNLRKPSDSAAIMKSLISRRKLVEICKELSGKVEPHVIFQAAQWLCYEGLLSADLNDHIWGNEMEVWINEQNPVT